MVKAAKNWSELPVAYDGWMVSHDAIRDFMRLLHKVSVPLNRDRRIGIGGGQLEIGCE